MSSAAAPTAPDRVVFYRGQRRPVIWAPQCGSQTRFLQCPVLEVLYEGTRGPGKTDALLMDFCQHVGQGFGDDWKGVLFRRTHPELQDVIEKARRWISQIWPAAEYNEAKSFWRWPTGELLYFRHFAKPADYWSYHGHSYPWIGWEELTTWPDDACFKSMFSCSRSTRQGLPRKIRSTTNPYGVGHNWVRRRYDLPVPTGQTIGRLITDARDQTGEVAPPRVAVHGYLDENQILMRADPNYKQRIRAAARNASELKAWLEGSWDIVAGGMVDDVWDRAVHVLEPFTIPQGWLIDRAFDWGSSKPFALGWWAESDGTIAPNGKMYPRGTLFLIAEWYGCTGKENEGLRMLAVEIARKGLEMEARMTSMHGYRVQPGPADPSIFKAENGVCIADDMARVGMRFEAADAGPGSRKNGAERVRRYLHAARTWPMEEPGLFVFSTCAHWLRTVPVIPRDDKDLDDVDCFVAGTQIATPTGSRPVEQLAVGDLVQTPIGPRPVLRAGCAGRAQTYRVQISTGVTLEGTGDHKIYVDGRGLVPLCRVAVGDMVATEESIQWLRNKFTRGFPFDGILAGAILNAGRRWLNGLAPAYSIASSGNGLMVPSQRGTTCTIGTMMPPTMRLTIFNSWLRQSMRDTMPKSDLQTVGISGRCWSDGVAAMMGSASFETILKNVVRTLPSENVRALIVAVLLLRSTHDRIIAQTPVRWPWAAKGLWRSSARSAARQFWSKLTAPDKPRPVVMRVDGPCDASEVFFLTVEQAHLFWANGVLSTNTESEDHEWDQTRYRVMFQRRTVSAQKLVGV